MGIFSKIGKGIKKVFSHIAKRLRKSFKRIGKFINKIGIVGQIAMMFILPGVGNALMNGLTGLFRGVVGQTAAQAGAAAAAAGAGAGTTAAAGAGAAAGTAAGAGTAAAAGTLGKATGMMASKSAIIRGAGSVLQAAGNFVSAGAKAFSTVTEGITSFMGEFVKTGLNKIPGINIGSAAPTFGDAWANVQNNVMNNASATLEAFNKSIGVKPTAGATKFGTAGYTAPSRVSVDSLAAAKSAPQLTGADLRPAVVDVAPQQMKVTPDMTQADIGRADAYNAALERNAARQAISGDASFVKTGGGDSLLASQQQSAATFDYSEFMKSSEFKNNFTAEAQPGSIEYDFGSGQKSYISLDKFTNLEGINELKQFQTGAEIAKPKGFFAQIGENITGLPEKVKTSILDMPKRIGEIPGKFVESLAEAPGKFVDNLTGTITDLPTMAARAALNRQPTPYYQQSRVSIGSVPEFHMPQSEPLQTPEEYVQFYQNPQRVGQGNYGFNNPAGYSQFMTKFASA
jgi:hypothetical protein